MYALRYGAIITAEVKDEHPKRERSPLVQRCTRYINWNVHCMRWCCQNIKIKENLETVQIAHYPDQCNKIL